MLFVAFTEHTYPVDCCFVALSVLWMRMFFGLLDPDPDLLVRGPDTSKK